MPYAWIKRADLPATSLYGSIAQSVEHAAVNRSVEGSSPSVPANLYKVAQKINNMHIEGKSRNLK